VNRHPSENVECTVKLGHKSLDGKYRATLLTSVSPDSYNDIEHPDRVTPQEMELTFKDGVVDLPPHSLTIIHETSKKCSTNTEPKSPLPSADEATTQNIRKKKPKDPPRHAGNEK
jgi:hypothetical protein